MTADTTQVTVRVGGNDLSFTDVLTEVAKPAWLTDSEPILKETERRVDIELLAVLKALYATLRDRAPCAQVVVVAYPALFFDGDCRLITVFTDEEIARLNLVADRLAAVMAGVRADTDVEFVDVRDEIAAHGTCADPEWINGPSWPLVNSYHPNEAEHAAYAKAALEALGQHEEVPAGRLSLR